MNLKIAFIVLYGINASFFALMARGAWEEFHDPGYGGNRYDLYASLLATFLVVANGLAVFQYE